MNKEIEKNNDAVKSTIRMISYVSAVIILALILNVFVGQKIRVSGESMENTLFDKESLILEKVTYRFHNPERYDIIVFRPYEKNQDTLYIKRVIGLPGETVQIKDGDIYINDSKLEENYGKEKMDDPGIASEPILLKDEEYFVLGDNRNWSIDSRDSSVGVITEEQIVGRAVFRLWPLNQMGGIE